MPTSLLAELRTWSADRLERLLRARPDLAGPPVPADLAALAAAAGDVRSLHAAVLGLRPAQRLVLEALLLLPGVSAGQLAALSDPAPAEADVQAAVQDLQALLLLDRARRPPAGLDRLLPAAVGLGVSYERWLPAMNAEAVHRLASGFGLRRHRSKALAQAALRELLQNPERMRERLLALPPDRLARLRALDAVGPVVAVPELDRFEALLDDGLEELADAGLVLFIGGPYLEVPREVALGLRHPRPLRLVATALEPPGAVGVDPTAAAAGGAAAAYGIVTALDALAAELDRQSLPLLASGGVGVRELRRLADLVGTSAAGVGLLLEASAQLGLVRMMSKDVRLTRRWDSWASGPPAQRWAQVAAAWRGLAGPVAGQSGRLEPALRYRVELPGVRGRLLTVLHEAAREQAAPAEVWQARFDARWFAERLQAWGWSGPSVAGPLLAGLLTEATLLGLLAEGAPTPLTTLSAPALTALDDVGEERVRAQADGTLVCTGPPSPRMRADLDRLAVVESRGAGTVWRLTEGSLQGAYASGLTADAALTALQRWGGELPQAMAYLVGDAERRAGRLRVGAAGSYVVAEDAGALGDALAALRGALKGGALERLAPTVVVSTAEPEVLAAALKKAGLAGATVRGAARPKGKRAPAPDIALPGPVVVPDPGRLAAELAAR